MRSVVTAALVVAFVLEACSGASPARPSQSPGADVTSYRGDSARTGVMPGPGPAGAPSVAWSFKAGAPIGSSPLVIGDAVVLVDRDGTVHALNLSTGIESWKAVVGAEVGGSPVGIDGRVVVGDGNGRLTAFDVKTGAPAWTSDLDDTIQGSPARLGGLLIAATMSGTAYGLDASTGAVKWSTPVGAAVTKSIAMTADRAFLGLAGGEIVAIATTDGAIQWRASVAQVGEIGTPSVSHGMVFAAAGIDGDDPAARSMTAVDEDNGTIRWRFSSPTHAQVYTAAIVDDAAFVVDEDGAVAALDASTGAVRWSMTTKTGIEALPSVADGVVYVAGNDGPVTALDAATGTVRWSVPIQGVPFAPTIARGYLLVGTNVGTLYAIGGPAT